MKYIVSINTEFGSISAESKHPEDLEGSLDALRKLARDLKSGEKKNKKGQPVSQKKSDAGTSPQKKKLKQKSSSPEEKEAGPAVHKGGQGETTLVLREIESRLLETGFFDKPETTGQVKSRLEYETGKKFTSRKVSQALGILRSKGSLTRAGKRNSYSYSKKYLEEKAGISQSGA